MSIAASVEKRWISFSKKMSDERTSTGYPIDWLGAGAMTHGCKLEEWASARALTRLHSRGSTGPGAREILGPISAKIRVFAVVYKKS